MSDYIKSRVIGVQKLLDEAMCEYDLALLALAKEEKDDLYDLYNNDILDSLFDTVTKN